MHLAAGIDLSGRTTGTTAVAWVGGAPDLVDIVAGPQLRGRTGDAEIARLLAARRPDVVAIDAPLSLPHAVTCTDPDCADCFPVDGVAPSYGSREIDGARPWANVGHSHKPPMPMVMIAGIAFRAIYLRRLLAPLPVIETWPMGVYRALAPAAGGDTGDAWRRSALASVVGGAKRLRGTDRLDAVAAAYAAWCYLTGRATEVVAREDEGSIWLPRDRSDSRGRSGGAEQSSTL
jgi:predicted nuclease with RNAse H fold